jgi:hypothetical protein
MVQQPPLRGFVAFARGRRRMASPMPEAERPSASYPSMAIHC